MYIENVHWIFYPNFSSEHVQILNWQSAENLNSLGRQILKKAGA